MDDHDTDRRDAPTGRTRRAFLAAGAAGVAGLLAGCQGSEGEAGDTATATPAPDTTTVTHPPPSTTPVSTTTERYRLDRDLPYHETPHGTMRLDLYRPRDATDVPFVVFCHGGGWVGGDKGFRPMFPALVEAGVAVADVRYRLVPDVTYPAPVRDVVAATTWVRANAGDYGIDPGRGALAGYSAGAHLAALVAVAPEEPAFHPAVRTDTSAAVDALVAFSGIYDLADPRATENGLVQSFVGEDAPDADFVEASPVTHVDGDDPPAFLLHGTEDSVVPYESTERLAGAYRDADVPVSVFTAEGAGHGFVGDDRWREEYLPPVIDHLRARLGVEE